MNKIGLSILLISVLVVLLSAGCGSRETPALPTPGIIASPVTTPDPTGSLIQTETGPVQPTALTPAGTPRPTRATVIEQPGLVFASYPLEPVTAQPSLQQEAIDPQMGNVLVPLALSTEQVQRLAEAGVVASPADYPEFHILYKETVQNNLPVFVTSDALLHAYHLTFDQLLSSLEEEVFLPKLRELNQALLAQIRAEYEQLKGTTWEDPAWRASASG
jgi:hypothetical protein